MSAVPTSAPEFKRISLSSIVRNPNNPRKVFEQAALDELTASVKARGVLEPLLVRPVGKGFELVAGERRWLAAKAAKLADVPCMVEERTDAVAAEDALLENIERVDLTALEEGEALARLRDEHKRSIEDLVALTGKSRTVVFGRMKLTELQGEARELVLKGELSASIADRVARYYPTPQLQGEALELLKGHWKVRNGGGLKELTYDDACDLLDEQLRLRLKDAPFNPNEGLPGPCKGCLKRTGAQPEAFPGTKDDTCLDAPCWKKKEKQYTKAVADELKAEGKTLIKDGADLFSRHDRELTLRAAETYQPPTAKVEGAGKTWKQLLGDELPVSVAIDAQGKAHELVDKQAALRALKAKDAKAAAKVEAALNAPDPQQEKYAREEKKRQAELLVFELVVRRAAPRVTAEEAVELAYETTYNEYSPEAMALAGLPADMLRAKVPAKSRVALVFADAAERAYGPARASVAERWAKKAKLDLKKLRKQAAAAVAGTCWVCGCNTGGSGERHTDRELARSAGVELKACKGGCSWVNGEKTLCSSCAGGKGAK